MTIITHNLISELEEWNVLEVPTASDYWYIKIKLFIGELRKTRRLTVKGKEKVLNAIKQEPWFKEAAKAEISTPGQLEEIIETFYDKLDSLKRKYARKLRTRINKLNPGGQPNWKLKGNAQSQFVKGS